eukprot:TRINITY_DN12211_c0_g6_i4.p3 TRINITY_DN12211_c0_g6~~TRINITY_DN12211_c0_g6_i4.p3  ORF type:complete len:120 (+),score=5.83 TRINITY_DN12211_c0_g6_i4:1562-1921(+)
MNPCRQEHLLVPERSDLQSDCKPIWADDDVTPLKELLHVKPIRATQEERSHSLYRGDRHLVDQGRTLTMKPKLTSFSNDPMGMRKLSKSSPALFQPLAAIQEEPEPSDLDSCKLSTTII